MSEVTDTEAALAPRHRRRGMRAWAAGRQRFLFGVGVAAYVATRVAFTATRSVTALDDTASYESVSVIGNATRPWVLPALFAITSDRVFALAQTVVSAVAFLVLGLSIASTLNDRRARFATGLLLVLLGLTPRVMTWDSLLVTESLSISMTLLLLAVIARRDLLVHRWVAIGSGVAFALWVFLRDSHALLSIPIAVVAGSLLIRRRQIALAGVVVVLAVLAFAAGRNNRDIEAFNVTANVVFHVSYDADRLSWMIDSGMPDVAGLNTPDPFARQDALNDDATFQSWARGPGLNTYIRFLAAHPSFTLEALPAILFDVGSTPEGMVDHTFANYPDPPPSLPFAALWPKEATAYTIGLLGGALVVVLWAERTKRDRRLWATPALLALTTLPHAGLVYHGAPIELARHGIVLSTVLTVSLWWIIAVGIDQAISERSTLQPQADTG